MTIHPVEPARRYGIEQFEQLSNAFLAELEAKFV